MNKRIRLIALAGVAALALLVVPSVSTALPIDRPHAPIITFPVQAGGYNTTANLGILTVFGTVDVTVDAVTQVTVRLGDPPCPPAGCGFGPILGTAVPDVFGNWSVDTNLPEGQHRIYVTAQNINGDSVAALRDFLIDNTIPLAPTIDFPTGGEIFPTNVVPISGTAEPRAHVVIQDEIGNIRSTTALLDGTWSYNAIFPAGPHTITAYQEDLARNLSPVSAPVSFDVDTDVTPPGIPTIDTPLEGELLGPSGVVVAGTAEPFSTVEVCEDRPDPYQTPPPFMGAECEVSYGTDIADALGAYSVPLPSPLPPGQNGLHFVRARATDPAGNIGEASPVRTFEVDALRPTVTVSKPSMYLFASPTLLNGGELTGTARDNVGVASVRVQVFDFFGDLVADDTAACSGCAASGPALFVTWSDEPVLSAPGLYFVEVTSTDQVGNVSTIAEINLLVLF